MKNAVIKSVGSRSRVSIPKVMSQSFDVTQPVYIIRNGENSIALTQFSNVKTNKSRSKKIEQAIGLVNPYSNGVIQFRLSQYFKDQTPESVVCFTDMKDNVIVHCLD